MINPGSVAGQMPAGDDVLIRRIQDIERNMREMMPAVMEMTTSQYRDLQAQLVTLTDVVNHQIASDRTGGATGNFAIPTTATSVNTQTIAVPAGYSRALVFVVTSATFYSLSTPSAGVYLKARVGTTVDMTNATSNALDPANGFNWASMSSSASATLTGLSGGNITAMGCVSSTNAIPADVHNVCNLDALVVFLR